MPTPILTAEEQAIQIRDELYPRRNTNRRLGEALLAVLGEIPEAIDGNDGREVQLQKTATHLQWRYAGVEAWTDLIALSQITGPSGNTPGVAMSGDQITVNGVVVGPHLTGPAGPSAGWVLLGSATANNSAAIYVDGVVSADYDVYLVTFANITQTGGDPGYAELLLRSAAPYSNIPGTYATTWTLRNAVNGVVQNTQRNGTLGFTLGHIRLYGTGAGVICGEANITLAPNGAAKMLRAHACSEYQPGTCYGIDSDGYNANTTPVGGFGLAINAGNIRTGTIAVYGLKKS